MKQVFFAIAILLLVNSSKQQEPDTTTTAKSIQVNLNDIIERKLKQIKLIIRPFFFKVIFVLNLVRKTVCGCDENIAVTCLTTEKNQTESSLTKRVVRSIETVSGLWFQLKSLANLIQSTPGEQQGEQQQQQSCHSVTQIKCSDSTQQIQVIKADVTNADLTVCPTSTLKVDPELNTCPLNRIQSTELAQKL